MSTAQDAGKFQCHYYVPVCTKRKRRKSCHRKWKERLVRQTTYSSKRTNVTLRASWVHARSRDLRDPRETESKLQTWSSNPTSSGSRTWPKEEIEQSIDLRVDGIPNDETYKDEQYMQRIADQVQKLVNTERFIKNDSPEDNILSEQAAKKIHEASNWELHEVQQRTDIALCQRCY